MLTIHLSIVVFLPLATGLVGAFLPGRMSRWVALLGAVAVLAYWIAMVFDFPTSGGELQYVTQDKWIDELGVSYALGVDGLNLFLIGLTAILWVAATAGGVVPRVGPAAALLLPHGAGRDRGARRVHGPGPGAVRRLLRPDARAVLLPDRRLGRVPARVRDHQGRDLHAGRVAADARGRGRARRAVRHRERAGDLVPVRRPPAAHAPRGHAELDLLAVRDRVPREDAGVPASTAGCPTATARRRSRC